MTAESADPEADFSGELVPPPSISFLSGEPVKIQASHLSNFLTTSLHLSNFPGSALQKVQQVEISMSPSKLSVPLNWPTRSEPTVLAPAPPGLSLPPFVSTSPEPSFSNEPCYNSWPETPWNEQMMASQIMAEQMMAEPYIPLIEQNMPEEPYQEAPPSCTDTPGTPSPPHVLRATVVAQDTSAPGVECSTSAVADQKELFIVDSSGESTELSGPADSSTSDDEWSGHDSGSTDARCARGAGHVFEDTAGTELDVVRTGTLGRMILSFINHDASDLPTANVGPVNELNLDPPPGLPIPLCLSSPASGNPDAQDMVEPPPGLILPKSFDTPQTSQSSGSDADISDGEVHCSASPTAEQQVAAPCAAEVWAISSPLEMQVVSPCATSTWEPAPQSTTEAFPEMQVVSPCATSTWEPAPQSTTEDFQVVSRGKCNKPMQKARSLPAASEAAHKPISAHQKKVAVPVPLPQQLVSPSCNKAGGKSQQPRKTSLTQDGRVKSTHSSKSLLMEVQGLADNALDEESTGFCLLSGAWTRWLVLALVLSAVLFALVASSQDSSPVDPSLAYEIRASAMTAPGVSHVWVTAAPASASGHLWGQHIASLARSMDIEFARGKALASSLKSKMKETKQTRDQSRQQKEQMRARHFQQLQQVQEQQGLR